MFDSRESRILADRYLESVRAEWRQWTTLGLVSPLLALVSLGLGRGLGWESSSLYGVMAASAFWLGALAGHREISREWGLLWRERMVGLSVGSYLYSKLRVLAPLGIIPIAVYAFVLELGLELAPPVGWLVLNLSVTSLCGLTLGLVVSALASQRSNLRYLVHPIAWLQILAVAPVAPSSPLLSVYHLAPIRWSTESLERFTRVADSLAGAARLLPLLAFTGFFSALAAWLVARWTSREGRPQSPTLTDTSER